MVKSISHPCFFLIIFLGTMVSFSCARSIQAHYIPKDEIHPETARIYILRPSPSVYGVKQEIYENNFIVGQLGPRGYIVWDTKAGAIILDGPWGFVKVMAEQGKTYYFKLHPKTFSAGRSSFFITAITEKEGKATISKLKKPQVNVID